MSSRRREEFTEFVQALRDLGRELLEGPEPSPVEYRRCPECGKVRPITRHRRTLKLTRSDYLPTPPEYECSACGAYSVRLVGDIVNPNDPAVTSVKVICTAPEPRLIVHRWQKCRYHYTAPWEAHPMLQCPRCGTTGTDQVLASRPGHPD